MKEQILVFGFQDHLLKAKLKAALMPLHIRLKIIPPEEYGKTIGELAAGSALPDKKIGTGTPIFGNSENDPKHPFEPQGSADFPSPMLVFGGLSSGRLDAVLMSLRKQKLSIPYKAVITSENISWTPKKLYTELVKEHETMHR